jgi:hypothetical protein
MADTTITPTDVITEFGSYYIDQGQNMQSLLMRPFHPFGTRDAFTNVPTDNTQLRYSDVTVGEILQRYQDTFTAKGEVVFSPVKIDLSQVKIDQEFNPNNLVYSWLGFLTNNNVDRSTWPFIRWFIEVYLLNQLFEDIETKAVYKGEQAAIVVGTAGTAIGAITGVKKIINDNIADMTQIGTGAFAADPVDFVTQIEQFVKSVDERYRDRKMFLNLNNDRKIQFVEGMQKKYNTYYAQVPDTLSVRNFDNVIIKGRTSMSGSDKIWMTPTDNAVFATKGFGNANAFELEKSKRKVQIFTDFHIGIGFLQKDLVFTNDLDM